MITLEMNRYLFYFVILLINNLSANEKAEEFSLIATRVTEIKILVALYYVP